MRWKEVLVAAEPAVKLTVGWLRLSGIGVRTLTLISVLAAVVCAGMDQTLGGSILREVWSDIPGSSMGDLKGDPRFPGQPSETNLITDLFEAPVDAAENYGQRMHGYILPPVTGEYEFWLATDDAGELWLSTDENPANQRLVAQVQGWTSSREWTREENQHSARIHLVANQAYYVAALQKEGNGGDNLAVRWLRPDGVDEAPIPATYLLPWGTSFTPPGIVQQPSNATTIEGQAVTFTVAADPSSPCTFQWQRNGVPVGGATSPSLTYGPAGLLDQGARFRAVLSNRLGTVTSQEAILSVTPDVTPPTVLAVQNLSPTRLQLRFSEPLEAASARTRGNYQLDGPTVSTAEFGEDTSTIVLTTSPVIYGTRYSLQVANVQDRAATPNRIANGTVLNFTAVEYLPRDIGISGGSTTIVAGGYDLASAGNDLGGTSDQCHFAYQERTGDFDLRVRVAQMSITHPFVQAGLMVREGLEPGAQFVGVFASSVQLGCFMESRATAGAATQIAAPVGGFPVNYPHTWLRLRRSGSQFTTFGSLDGKAWQQFGNVTLSAGSKMLFGMTIASHDTNKTAVARFRELGPVASPSTFTYAPVRERLGPSNRRTGLVFSEIMFHPADRADGKELEFIEIYNGESIFADLTGWRLTGAVEYEFPNGFQLPAGEFVVIAADPAAVQSVYGISGVLGPFDGRLNNAGDTLQLLNAAGAVRLHVEYSPEPPWPVAADGLGHSLVLARPSYGENDLRAWSASDQRGGSPGAMDASAPNAWSGLVINEFLAHTDDPVLDFIELFNTSNAPIDLSGCFLSDDSATNKFQIPVGTILNPRSYVSFNQNQLGFALSSAGETIYLLSSDQTRVLDAVRFGGQENGVSTGRAPDGAPSFRRLAILTPGGSNSAVRSEQVVINEIMYHPISDLDADQYVELHNLTGTQVDLTGWRLTSGVAYQFPAGAVLPANGYVVVAKDAARLRENYTQLTAANTFGDFSGALSRSGELIVLTKPDLVVSTNIAGLRETNVIHIAVSEVSFRDGGRWPELADGGGSSIELIDARSDSLRASNWKASDETQKSTWGTFEFTGRVDFANSGVTGSRFQIGMQGAGECLVDNLEVLRVGSTNLLANGTFENGATGWTFFGNHRTSSIDDTGAFAGQSCLHVRSFGDGDTGNNTIRANMSSTVLANQMATIRARVRWLAGWPEVLLRVRGNGIEFPIHMDVPKNLGTPGLANSRRVNNSGPAIFDVVHTPALPRANQAVLVTCRVSDPDGVVSPRLRYRVDPASTLTSIEMRDDGLGGDATSGDGVFTATLNGRTARDLVAFHIEAKDDSAASQTTLFPSDAPARECLIRWDDPIPFGTFAHYHMWNTAATDQARSQSRPLDNTYRDCTLVYGDFRIIYNAGFRDKGSPYHGGSGDYAVTVPSDDLLLGANDRVFGSTGNGGSEGTGMRGDVSAWIGQQLGIPYLHSHYMRLYRNGTRFREILYDLEQPNPDYAADWFGGGDPGDDLFKIAVWFEFSDNNSDFQSTSATLERFQSQGEFKLARYRWNWQIRPSRDTANDYSSIFNLVTAANNSADRVTGLMNLADVEQWMRVFAFNRIVGNWDSWSFTVGQNMYLYAPLGQRATLMPWDVDFVLGEGNGASDALWGGQDPVVNQLYNVPTYRRMLWRAYQDAINGPMQPTQYGPQIDARRAMLVKNGLTSLSDPRGIKTYIDGRRNHLQNQIRGADAQEFAITSNGGSDFSTNGPTATLTGTAPFAVATIEVNGIPYPITWTGFTSWRISVPLGTATNQLQLVGRDLRNEPVAGASDSITIRSTGTVPRPEDWLVINEMMYHPLEGGSEFIEIHNRHPNATFDLSGVEISGAGFVFPGGTVILPNSYVVVVADRSRFADEYGSQIPVAGEFTARLDNNGETLRLLKVEATGSETLIDQVRYDRTPPWPGAADGLGASLQLIDPAEDNQRAGNWASTTPDHVDRATPGRSNAIRVDLEPFPQLWINEVLPQNVAGLTDTAGEREPWVELYNSGSTPISLSGFYLSDDDSERDRWALPAGATMAPGQFLLIWADAQPAQTIGTNLHASFRLNPTNGVVLLSRIQGGSPIVVDHVQYAVTSRDQSFGSVPDGEAQRRRVLLIPTPAAPNNSSSPDLQVFINEWLASNRTILTDPADGNFDDWFELFNAGVTSVDLSGYFLTDDLTDPTQFRIPNGTVLLPGGFLTVWADDDVDQSVPGGSLHTNFRLAAGGGEIGLFGLDETPIDTVSFGAQTADVSQGRFADGYPPPFYDFLKPTPGASNDAEGANRAPRIDPIADVTVFQGQNVAVVVNASDPDQPAQTLAFDLPSAPVGVSIAANGNLLWTPAPEIAPGTYSITVRVTDNGTPARSALRTFNVTIIQINQPPTLPELAPLLIPEGSPFQVQFVAQDPNLPPQKLVYSLAPGAPDGAGIDELTGEFTWTPLEGQGPGAYTVLIRVTDDGEPPLTAERPFSISVQEVNNPPAITQISPQSVSEGAQLSLAIEAADPDNPPATLTYLIEDAPAGVAIDPASGLLRWTPTEVEGPRDYQISVRVREGGDGPSAVMSFLVGVHEVNTAPVLQPNPSFSLRPNDFLVVTNRALDSDLPEQTLTFTTATPLPSGATLNPGTGVLTWALGADPRAGTNVITIRVADDGTPPLSAEQTLQVVIDVQPRIAINEIMRRPSVTNAEFIELANYSLVNTVDLSGWRLEGFDYSFAPGTIIEPRGYLCVARSLQAFRTAYGEHGRVVGNAQLTIPEEGGMIRLLRPNLQGGDELVVDEVFFQLREPWPAAARQGASLQLIDAEEDHTRVGNWAAAIGNRTNAPFSVIPIAGSWRYWQNGTSPGANWNSRTFNDGAWPSGNALLYVESAGLPAPKNTALTLGQTTYYFRSRFNFTGNSAGARIRLTTVLDDGAIFYLNGQEIYRVGMRSGTVGQSTFATRTVGDADLEETIDLPSPSLQTGENVLAVEVHQINATSSDIVFGAEVQLITVDVVSFTPGSPNSVAADLPAFPSVWINEILPDNATGLADSAGDRDPWIEIFHADSAALSLSGWFLTDDLNALSKWAFPPATTVPGQGFLLVWGDGESGESSANSPHTSFRLAKPTGIVALARNQNGTPAVVDYLEYNVPVSDKSYGSVPDGSPWTAQILSQPSPGSQNAAPPVPASSLSVALQSGSALAIRCSTVPGLRYVLEVTNDLSQPNWHTVREFTGDGAVQSFTEQLSTSDPQQYFRVVAR